MKRLNPNTGLPFEHGAIRHDGYMFTQYHTDRVKKNGFFVECWRSPQARANRKISHKQSHKKIRQTIDGRAIALLSGAKGRALKNKAIISINKNWIIGKLDHGVCEVTGMPFDFLPHKHATKNPYSPSLDRIDSKNKNYTPENTRVVLTFVNLSLNEWSIEDVTPIIKKLSELL